MDESPATWNILPLETRNQILYHFCSDIINEYKQLTSEIRDAIPKITTAPKRPRVFSMTDPGPSILRVSPNFLKHS